MTLDSNTLIEADGRIPRKAKVLLIDNTSVMDEDVTFLEHLADKCLIVKCDLTLWDFIIAGPLKETNVEPLLQQIVRFEYLLEVQLLKLLPPIRGHREQDKELT
jgi:hypothetical protein